MLLVLIQSLFFFFPAYCANMTPIIFAHFHLFEFLNLPIDLGKKLMGQPLFGSTKTYRGLICGTVIGILVTLFQYFLYVRFPELKPLFLFPYFFGSSLFLGFLLGFGVLLGDLVKSFFKRRFSIKSTDAFFPFDEMDYLGALLPVQLLFPISYQHFFLLLFLSPILPILANLVAYKLGWKKVWW